MILDDLADWLIINSLAEDGAIFLGAIGDEPAEAIMLNEYAGEQPRLTHQRTGTDRARVQLQVRSEDYVAGRTRIEEIYQAFLAASNFTIGGTVYKQVLPLQSPFELRRDENGRIWFAVNFAVEKELSPI